MTEATISVVLPKEELLKILGNNRGQHRQEFEKALAGYKKAAIRSLEKRIKQLEDGKEGVELYINLPTPRDHTHDYDRVIRMLSMHVDNQIEISERRFDQIVMDHWSWTDEFSTTNSAYVED